MVRHVVSALKLDPRRSLLSVLALASAVAVMLLFEGFRTGLYHQLRTLPEQLQSDLVVSQAGIRNFAAARSSLRGGTRKAILAVDGVASAHALTLLPLIFRRDGVATPVQVIAYVDVGGPPRLAAGRPIEEAKEIVVDASLAADHGLSVGDDVEFLGWTFHLVGISEGTAAMFTPAVFARFADLVDLYMSGDLPDDVPPDVPLLSYMLVRLQPNADPNTVRAALEEAVPWADVHAPSELGDADEEMGRRLMGPVLGLLVALSYLIGALVAGLALYGSVLSRLGEFAVMSALGARPLRLASIVLAEAAVIAVAALGVGALAAVLGAGAIEAFQADYIVEPLGAGAPLRTAAAVLVLTLLGSVLPLVRVVRVDPASVFGGGPC